MRNLFTILFLALFAAGAKAQLTQVVLEEYTGQNPENIPEGYTCYRIYAELNDPDDALVSVFGADCEPLEINLITGEIFNHAAGATVGNEFSDVLLDVLPDVEYDSYLTVNQAPDIEIENAAVGSLAALPHPNVWVDFFGQNATEDLIVEDGVVYALPTSPNAYGLGENNRVLLGQITTNGIFQYKFNIQVLDGGVGGQGYIYMAANTSCDISQGGILVNGSPLGIVGGNGACADPTACNYNPNVDIEDSVPESCDFSTCAGCTNAEACNYSPSATIDDGSCDLVCFGCTDPTAENYDEAALTDDGSCNFVNQVLDAVYAEVYYEDDGSVEGYPSNHTTYRIYADINDPSYGVLSVYAVEDCTDLYIRSTTNIWNSTVGAEIGSELNANVFENFPASQYDSFVTLGVENSSQEGFVQALGDDGFLDSFSDPQGADLNIEDGAWFSPYLENPLVFPNEEGRVLLAQVTTDGQLSYKLNLQIRGLDGDVQFYMSEEELLCNVNPINGIDLGLIYPQGFCLDPLACNYDNSNPELADPAVCEYESCAGCLDQAACNYDGTATVDDASCDYTSCTGCTDPLACNYDASALIDDGSCVAECAGCTDPASFNFDPNATVDDGSCSSGPLQEVFHEVFYQDDGTVPDYPAGHTTYRIYAVLTTSDVSMTGVYGLPDCTQLYVRSSTNIWNHALGGTFGSEISPPLLNALPAIAYDSYVTIGEATGLGSGSVQGLSIPGGLIGDSFGEDGTQDLVLNDGLWYSLPGEPNTYPDENGRVLLAQVTTDGDLSYKLNLQLRGDDSTVYNYETGPGNCTLGAVDGTTMGLVYPLVFCGDPEACNYVEADEEHYDINECDYTTCLGCTDINSCHFDPTASIDDGSCDEDCLGCTDASASNYDPYATVDDGTCLVSGCTLPFAINYDETVNDLDFLSCTFEGCNDPQATNYIINSDDSVPCEYDCEAAVLLNMTDLWNDGWNGGGYLIFDDEGNLTHAGDMDTAMDGDGLSYGNQLLCLPEGQYSIEIIGGDFPIELSWTLNCVGGETIEGSATPAITAFNVTDEDCGYGCTDVNASNYDPAATSDFGCVYEGCVDPAADNYSESAQVDDGSCSYELDGVVFYDANENGVFDVVLDFPITYQNLVLTPGNIIATTDNNGYYSFGEFPEGDYSISIQENATYPTNTTPANVDVSGGTNEFNDVNFGLTNSEPVSELCVDIYSWSSSYPCNGEPDLHFVCVRNMGNTVLSGYTEMEYDPAFQGHVEISPIDVVSGNTLQMEYDNLFPGEMLLFVVSLLGPDVEYIGETLTSTARAFAFNGGQEVATAESALSMEVTCAYDPNDKQAFPQGYAEPHLILNDTEIEYLIRFQNTGNAPATNVVVLDSLDANLDLSTFQLVANSHNVQTTLNPITRKATFSFPNIMLPDSTNNEPESHGLVSFKIRPLPGLNVNDVIENTAHIYFDSNPAIVTNTTWHTIYECPQSESLQLDGSTLCLGDAIESSEFIEYFEDYIWTVDGEVISEHPDLTLTPEESGVFQIEMEASNPLCEVINNGEFTVNELPDAAILETEDGLTFEGEGDVQWFLDGLLIEGATESSFIPTTNGEYTVEVTSDNGCTNTSEPLFYSVVGVGEQIIVNNIYPNPTNNNLNIRFSNLGAYELSLVDQSGRIVKSRQVNGESYRMNVNDLAAGVYNLRVQSKSNINTFRIIIQN